MLPLESKTCYRDFTIGGDNEMIRISDYYTLQYSTLPLTLGSAMFVYMGFVLMLIVGRPVAKWMWWSGVILFGCGVILQFATRRVLFIRSYQFIMVFVLAFTYGFLLLEIIVTKGRTKEASLLLPILLTLSLLMTMVGVYKNHSNKMPHFREKPIGPVWENFDPKTGTITRTSTKLQQQKQRQFRKSYSRLNRIGPLIAGLSMLIAGSLSNSSTNIAIILIAFVITFASSAALAALLFQLIGILWWEKTNGKHVIVKR